MTRTERYRGGLTGLTGLLFITTFPSIEKGEKTNLRKSGGREKTIYWNVLTFGLIGVK